MQALIRDFYLCVRCKANGDIKPATDVDHIRPFNGKDDTLRLDIDNLQSLCKACHSRKTAKEDGGFGHAKS
ncbi:HNH endonuclease [Granulicella mallensis]|uniref:HNH endonuclease n=1 Tax=Granulicella mallensis TaxID=940614 RepID=UPI001CBFD4D8